MFKILDDKHPSLRKVCTPFEEPYQEEDKKLLKNMVEYLKLSQDDAYASSHNIRPGVGLALPQIGITKRGFAIYMEDNGQVYRFGLINPVILRTSLKKAYLQSGEGCLSVPKDHPGLVMRYNKIVLRAYDVFEEKEIDITAFGYLAICLQHELDHLDGILYYDHINKQEPFKLESNSIAI